MDDYKISTNEAVALITSLLCNKLFLSAPYIFKETAGSGALVMIIYYYIIALLVTFLISGYYKKTGKNYITAFTGNKAKALSGLIISAIILCITIIIFRQYTDNLKEIMLPASPIFFIVFILGAASILSAVCGLKGICKASGFFMPIIIVFTIILIVFGKNSFDWSNLFPVFGKGFNSVFGKGFFMLSTLFEMVIFFYLPPFLKESKDFRKIGLSSLIISMLFYLIVISGYLLTAFNSSNEMFPPIFRIIRQSSFLNRPESIFLAVYSISALLYISSMLYFTARIFSDGFGITYYKQLIPTFGLIICCVCLINVLSSKIAFIASGINMFLWIIPFVFTAFPILLRSKK